MQLQTESCFSDSSRSWSSSTAAISSSPVDVPLFHPYNTYSYTAGYKQSCCYCIHCMQQLAQKMNHPRLQYGSSRQGWNWPSSQGSTPSPLSSTFVLSGLLSGSGSSCGSSGDGSAAGSPSLSPSPSHLTHSLSATCYDEEKHTSAFESECIFIVYIPVLLELMSHDVILCSAQVM